MYPIKRTLRRTRTPIDMSPIYVDGKPRISSEKHNPVSQVDSNRHLTYGQISRVSVVVQNTIEMTV